MLAKMSLFWSDGAATCSSTKPDDSKKVSVVTKEDKSCKKDPEEPKDPEKPVKHCEESENQKVIVFFHLMPKLD